MFLLEWLAHNGHDVQFEFLEEKDLNSLLEKFYPEARSQKGEKYSKSTLVGIRAAINRFLRLPPHKRSSNIMTSEKFSSSNKMLYAVIKDLKKEGLDTSKHYPAISEIDLQKVKDKNSFNLNDPSELQQKVFFDLQYNFGRRGRENLRDFTKSTFLLDKDDSGREFLEPSFNELTKNHQQPTDPSTSKPRMYEHPNDSCPIKSYKLYISKLDPGSDILFTFQKGGKNFNPPTESVWYTQRPIGINTLGKFMTKISQRLGLSRLYTNHSIRATTVTQLSNAGFEARTIMRVTGHRCESSLRSYQHDNSDEQKRLISDTLMRPVFRIDQEQDGESPPELATEAESVDEEPPPVPQPVQSASSNTTNTQQGRETIQHFYNYNCIVNIIQK